MEPWEDTNGIWKSKASFFSWLRGHLRKAWTRYPIKNSFLKSNRFRASIGKQGREVWACKCERCEKTFPQSKIQVDHITPAGKLNDWKDVESFAKRLFTTTNELRILCKGCHEIITYAYIYDMDEADVPNQLKIIAFSQLKADKQKERLKSLRIEPASNNKERTKQYETHIKTQ